MSVLSCGRYHCPNIMCDRIVMGHYLCDECWQELLDYKSNWEADIRKNQVEELIEAFFATEPGNYINLNKEEIDEEFDRVVNGFRMR